MSASRDRKELPVALVTHNVARGDGQGRVNHEIVSHALRAGCQVTLYADRVDPALVEQGAQWVPLHPKQQHINLLKVREFARMADHALSAAKGPSVIHGNGYVLNTPHHLNTAHFVHGAWIKSPVHTARVRRNAHGLYQWTYTALNARWERRAYQQARIVVAISKRVREELTGIGIPQERIRTILNGVDLREFTPGHADRGALGLPENVPLALFVGDIRLPRKNLDTVLKAIAACPGIHLAVVGATEGSPYPALSAQLGLTDRVRFLGYRKDVPLLMRAADMFVFPSRYEACSLALLEALASGLPVVTAETAGGAEVVIPECGIVLANPGDRQGLANALRALVEDPVRRQCMGQAARGVAEQYSWMRMAEAYLELYRQS